jgi:hypothetical protein
MATSSGGGVEGGNCAAKTGIVESKSIAVAAKANKLLNVAFIFFLPSPLRNLFSLLEI